MHGYGEPPIERHRKPGFRGVGPRSRVRRGPYGKRRDDGGKPTRHHPHRVLDEKDPRCGGGGVWWYKGVRVDATAMVLPFLVDTAVWSCS